MTRRFPIRAALLALSAVLLLGGFAQNRRNELSARTSRMDREWAELQSELYQRSTLVPRLVEAVRESRVVPLSVVLELTRAQEAAHAARPAILFGPDIAAQVEEQARLSAVLRRFVAHAERDPALARDPGFRRLLDEVAAAEGRIRQRTRSFNAASRARNELLSAMPDRVSGPLFGATPSPLLPDPVEDR